MKGMGWNDMGCEVRWGIIDKEDYEIIIKRNGMPTHT